MTSSLSFTLFALLGLAGCGGSSAVDPETSTTVEPNAPEVAFRMLQTEIGTRIRGHWRMARLDFESSTIEFDMRPADKTVRGGFGALLRAPAPFPLAFHPVAGEWDGGKVLVLLGYDELTREAVIERWRLANAGGTLPPMPKSARWIVEDVVWAERPIRIEQSGNQYMNSLCMHPMDANVAFLGAHNSGMVLSVNLRTGLQSVVLSAQQGQGLHAPQLAGRSWNGLTAERVGDRGLRLTLMRGDYYCTISDLAFIVDEDGDGQFERVGRP